MNISILERKLRPVTICAALLTFAACGQQEPAEEPAADAVAETSEKVPVTTASDEALALFMEGRALFDDLHFVEANQKFLQAVEADEGFALGHLMVATTSQTAAEFFDAINKASGLAAGVSAGEQLAIQALTAASENDQEKQHETLKQLVALHPKDERTHMQLGNYLGGQQDFAGAVEHYKHATGINPGFASAYNAMGYAYRSLEDFDNAKSSFGQYIELIPDEANPYDSYAELLLETGSYDESIENYRKALEIDPYFGASYQGISIAESLKGDADLAQEAADQMLAAARNPTERQAAMFRSVTSHLFAGNAEAAMEVCDTMLAEAEVQGDYAAMGGVSEYMGDIMLIAGDAVKAEEHFAAALAQRQQADINDANKAQAKRAHMFKTTVASIVADDSESAAARAAEYTAAAEADGTAFERRRIHALAGYLAILNEDNAAGAEHLAKASQLNPIVLYWSAVANAELGNTEKAIDLATRAANRNTLSANLPFFRPEAMALVAELSATE